MGNIIEEWRPIIGYEDLYLISSLGNCIALKRLISYKNSSYYKDAHEIIPRKSDNRGYLRLTFTRNGKSKRFYVHILVATHFIDNPEKKRTVNHKDGNKANNTVGNLEWNTYSENHLHAYRELGRVHNRKGCTGEKSKSSKPVFCETNNTRYAGIMEASRQLNVSFQNISKVCYGQRKHAKGFIFKFA